jgi:hypothetical protein
MHVHLPTTIAELGDRADLLIELATAIATHPHVPNDLDLAQLDFQVFTLSRVIDLTNEHLRGFGGRTEFDGLSIGDSACRRLVNWTAYWVDHLSQLTHQVGVRPACQKLIFEEWDTDELQDLRQSAGEELLAASAGGDGAEAVPARWLTVKKAAQHTSLSERSIRRLVSADRVTPRRPVRGVILIDRHELDGVIAASTNEIRRGRGTK